MTEDFINTLCDKHPKMFYIVLAFYMSCSAKHHLGDSKLEKWRTCKVIYMWFFVNKEKMPKRKVFFNPLTTPDSSRCFIDPKQ